MTKQELEELREYLKSLPIKINNIDKQKAKRDFFYFVQSYLPHHIEFIKNESSKFRKFIYENLPTLTQKYKFLTFSAYRGAAKTTLISTFYSIFETIRQNKRYIIIISATQALSNGILELIRTEFLDNQQLKHDFNIQILSDKQESIVLNVDSYIIKIASFGAGAKIRGTKFLSYRPDLIIIDDLEEDELVLNKTYRDKQTKWFKKVIMKLPSRMKNNHNIILVGTILHHDSVFLRLKELADFYQNFPLVLDFKTFELDDTQLDVQEFKKEYANDKEAFLQEYQNIPLSKDSLTFNHYKTFDIMPKCDFFSIGIDPSMGKTKGDYFAVAIIGYNKKEKKLYATVKGYKKNPTDMIYTLTQTYIRYSKIARTIIAIETVAYQEFFKDVFKKHSKQLGLSIPIKEFKNNIPKEIRINSLAPLIKDETILIDKNSTLLIDELDTYPKSAHDDLLDALEMAKRAFDIGGGIDYQIIKKHQKSFKALRRLKFM